MNYVLSPWDVPSVPVVGAEGHFPVRHVYCVGRNYAEHAKEMGGDATKEPPFFFTKPADAVVAVPAGTVGSVHYPLATKNLHYELELVVAIGHPGVRLPVERANDVVFGYAIGLDMTRRDLQADMREKKRPWDIGKSFAESAPLAPIHPVGSTGILMRGAMQLSVNGQVKQQGNLADMIWDVPHVLAFLSQMYELLPGDLVFTGTPAGVGPVVAGDHIECSIEGLTPLAVRVAPPLE
jgi:fumarylpyruvate hydrolase